MALRDLPSGTLTFLFTDIEGSTRLLRDLGPEEYAQALSTHRQILRDEFARHGGIEVDTQGDAFFYAFRDAAAAASAAAAAHKALSNVPVRVRIGLHTGRPLLTEEGYVGADVHLGARIAAAGHGGQVLVSGETRRHIDVDVIDLGEHRLKDFDAPVAIFQLGDERFPPLKTISNTNLPRPASSFVGRERELAEIADLLNDSARLLTLTGPGGSGKTRLAIEAAATVVPDFKAGVFWVGLASLSDPALVGEKIAQTIGAKDGLVDHIGGREMLLLLDNLEQIVAVGPELASLLEACPNLHLLVTSRELLRVRGELEFPVLPLADREAMDLFCERARTAPDDTIWQLCRALDNLPLAIELAAARASVLSPAQILERLSQRLDLFKGGRDADPRQRTLRATIEWSFDLLVEPEKALFARLAVFRGGCTLESAMDVADADLDTLESLVDKSLVRHSGERFLMLETIRQFAVQRLSQLGLADDSRGAHARYFLGLAEDAEPHLLAPDERDTWNDRLESEHDNLRAAIDCFESRNEVEQAMRLAGAIAEFWDQRGHHQEALRRFASLLRADQRATAARAKALNGASIVATVCGDKLQGQRWAEEALDLHRRFGNEFGEAISTWQLGYIRAEEGDFSTAEEMLSRAIELLGRVGDENNLRWATRTLAFTYLTMGDLERARPLYEENLRRSRDSGDRELQAATLGGLTDIAIEEGRLTDAVAFQQESLRLVLHLNDELMATSRLCVAASVLAVVGRPETAARLIGYSASRYEQTGAVEAWVFKMNDKTLASVHKQIGEKRLTDAVAEGATLTPGNALHVAVAEMQAASEDLGQ